MKRTKDAHGSKLPIERLPKVESAGALNQGVGKVITAIVKVNTPGYVPEGVDVRARIDDTFFTGSLSMSDLERIQSDPQVASISVSRPLQMID